MSFYKKCYESKLKNCSRLSTFWQLDDEREKQKDELFLQELQELEDEFLIEYREKRLEEMRRALENVWVFIKNRMMYFGIQMFMNTNVDAIHSDIQTSNL